MFEPNKIYFVNEEPTGLELAKYRFPVIFRIFNPIQNTSTDVSYNTEGVRKVNTIPVLDLRNVSGQTRFNKTMVFDSITGEQGFTSSSSGLIYEQPIIDEGVISGVEKTLTIPEGITRITGRYFSDSNFNHINLSSTLEVVDEYALSGNNTKNLILPASLVELKNGCFSNSNIVNLTINEGIKSIGQGAFYQNKLMSINFPMTLEKIESGAFSENDITGTFSIPSNIKTIESSAFANNNITDIILNEGIVSLSGFQYNKITEISIPSTVKTIGSMGFAYNLLTSVTIPNNVTTIENNAFTNNQINSLVLPDSITIIGANAFYFNSLTMVELPSSIKRLEDGTFSNNNITSVKLNEGLLYLSGLNNNLLTSIEIPSTVTEIGGSALRGNNLTDVYIPDSVKSIGDYCFYENPNIGTISVPAGAVYNPNTIGGTVVVRP